jgi:hypothetical protein
LILTLSEQLKNQLWSNGRPASRVWNQVQLTKRKLWQPLMDATAFLDASWSVRERIWTAIEGRQTPPTCEVCSNRVGLNTDRAQAGFRKYCSAKCARSIPTDFSKYDREAANVKRAASMLIKYGHAYNSQRPEIKEILRNANIARVRFHMTEEQKKAIDNFEWLYNEYENKKRTASDIADEIGVYYGTIIEKLASMDVTIRRNPNQRSTGELNIERWIHSLGFDAASDYETIKPLDFDIRIADTNIVIEHDGLYWHSFEELEENPKHIFKTQLAEAANLQLLHVFEDEWKYKKDIWKSIILSKLGRCNKIGARKCNILEINSASARTFMESCHLQGFVGGTHYALFLDQEIVACITMGKHRFKKDANELLRFACKLNTTVMLNSKAGTM